MSEQRVSINLLSDRKRQINRRKALFFRVQYLTAVVLSVYVVVLGVLAVFGGIVGVKISKLEKAIESEKRVLSQLMPIESKYLLVVNKLNLLSDYMAKKVSLKNEVELVKQNLPEGVELSSVAIGEVKGEVVVQLSTLDMYGLNQLLNMVEKMVKANTYQKVNIGGIRREADGTYHLTCVFVRGGK